MVGEGFNPINLQNGVRLLTDHRGKFRLPDDDSLVRVFAAHHSGFGEATPSQFKPGEATWPLQAWGRVEGRWTSGYKPVVRRPLSLEGIDGLRAMLKFGRTEFEAMTDADGRFRYDRVPPGRARIARYQPTDLGGGASVACFVGSTSVDVQAGAVTPVTLDIHGRRLVARVSWEAQPPTAKRWMILCVGHPPIPQPPDEVKNDSAALRRWWQTPEYQQAVQAPEKFMMVPQPDGTVIAEDVGPGDYTITVNAIGSDLDDRPVASASADAVTFSVPEEPASDPIDLGVFTLRNVNLLRH